MGKQGKRIATDGGEEAFGSQAFGGLNLGPLPQAEEAETVAASPVAKKIAKNRGRVDVVRQRASGGGGWMTVVKNFTGISSEEKNDLKKRIQKRCGVGGSLKNGNIEIQGDKREEVRAVLEESGFRVVFAGG